MVPPEAYGGGEAFGGEQDAPPRYGKSVSSIASVREGESGRFFERLDDRRDRCGALPFQ
jgi:hypothetical protein